MGRLIDGSELDFFDGVASDMNDLAGEEINYYSSNKEKSKIDPLYGEYTEHKIDGPWKVPAVPKWPEQNPVTGETGYTVEFDGICTISRVHLEEKHAPYPVEGDIVEFWRTPYHDADSMGKGLFFDVIKVNSKGYLNDSPNFVQFVLTLKRRPQFGAERKL